MIFLVEAYGTGSAKGSDDLGQAVESDNPAAIRHLATIPVPGDQVVFRLFQSTSLEDLIAGLEAAEVRFDRISEVDARGLGPACAIQVGGPVPPAAAKEDKH